MGHRQGRNRIMEPNHQNLTDAEKDVLITAQGDLLRAIRDLLNPPCKEVGKSNHGTNQADIALKTIVDYVNRQCHDCPYGFGGTCLDKTCKLFAIRKILSKPE